MNESGYEFFVVETDDVHTRDLGLRSFRVRPCRGDYITTIDAYGVEQAFEVSAVIHPLESTDDEPTESAETTDTADEDQAGLSDFF